MDARRTVFATILAVVAVSGSLSGCGKNKSTPPPAPPEVGIVTLHMQPVTLTAELPGRTAPYAISEVRPQVGGIILKRLFTEGGAVTAGQKLYQIDPKPYRAAYDGAKAALANAQANLSATRAKAERYARLVRSNVVSQQDYDDARAAYRQAQASVEQQEANLEAARINLDYTRITAPISGQAGISNVTEGALVTANQANALTSIQTLDPIYVNITQSSTQLLSLKQAVAQGKVTTDVPVTADVSLELEDGTRYPLTGKLQFHDVTVDQTTGTITLRAIFRNPRHLLLPGMYVRAKIAEGVDPHAILAPQQGVARDLTGEPTAWVVGKDNKVEFRVLTVSRAVGNTWLVTSGLKDGDRLIVEGTQKVRPGIVVHPVPVSLPVQQSSLPRGR